MTTELRPAPSPHTDVTDAGAGQPHAHLENPDWPGYSLCLLKLTGLRKGAGDCPACVDLALANRRTWIAR